MNDREYRVTCHTCDYHDTAPNVREADTLASEHQFNNPKHRVGYRRVDIPREARQ